MAKRGLTEKQEKFVREFVECANASAAYRLAYSSENMSIASVNREAKRLTDSPKITTRLKELRKEHRDKHDITVASVAEEFDELKEVAVKLGQIAPAVSAVREKAKLFGLYSEDNDQKGLNVVILHDPGQEGDDGDS